MEHKKKKIPEKIARIATVLGQLRCREDNVPNLLTGKGKYNPARWGSAHTHVLYSADAGLSFPLLPWKLSFVFHWKNERHLMWGKKNQKKKPLANEQNWIKKKWHRNPVECWLYLQFLSILLCNSGGALQLLAESSQLYRIERQNMTKPWQNHISYINL